MVSPKEEIEHVKHVSLSSNANNLSHDPIGLLSWFPSGALCGKTAEIFVGFAFATIQDMEKPIFFSRSLDPLASKRHVLNKERRKMSVLDAYMVHRC